MFSSKRGLVFGTKKNQNKETDMEEEEEEEDKKKEGTFAVGVSMSKPSTRPWLLVIIQIWCVECNLSKKSGRKLSEKISPMQPICDFLISSKSKASFLNCSGSGLCSWKYQNRF